MKTKTWKPFEDCLAHCRHWREIVVGETVVGTYPAMDALGDRARGAFNLAIAAALEQCAALLEKEGFEGASARVLRMCEESADEYARPDRDRRWPYEFERRGPAGDALVEIWDGAMDTGLYHEINASTMQEAAEKFGAWDCRALPRSDRETVYFGESNHGRVLIGPGPYGGGEWRMTVVRGLHPHGKGGSGDVDQDRLSAADALATEINHRVVWGDTMVEAVERIIREWGGTVALSTEARAAGGER